MSDEAAISALLGRLRAQGRFAPRPAAWDQFYRSLRAGFGEADLPPKPLILSAHWSTTAADKHERLKEQLLWASRNAQLERAIALISDFDADAWASLPEAQWEKSAGGL